MRKVLQTRLVSSLSFNSLVCCVYIACVPFQSGNFKKTLIGNYQRRTVPKQIQSAPLREDFSLEKIPEYPAGLAGKSGLGSSRRVITLASCLDSVGSSAAALCCQRHIIPPGNSLLRCSKKKRLPEDSFINKLRCLAFTTICDTLVF